jgi:hypothetical protein
MWIIQKNAVPDEQQGTVQQLQVSFRSGRVAYQICINKSLGFSQSLSKVPPGGDIVWKHQISPKYRLIEIIKGPGNVVISSETEQNLLFFAGRILR